MSKIFVSHSEQDEILVKEFVTYLCSSNDINISTIFCSSIQGLDIRKGSDYINFIKDKIENSDIIIYIFSSNFLLSRFCLCELGASWVLKDKKLHCLNIPPVDYKENKAILNKLQQGNIRDSDSLAAISDDVTECYSKTKNTPLWDSMTRDFLKIIDALIAALPKPNLIDAAKYEKLENNYTASLNTITSLNNSVIDQKAIIDELMSIKDKDSVNDVILKHSSEIEAFDKLKNDVKSISSKISNTILDVIYKNYCGTPYPWPSRFEYPNKCEDIEEGISRKLIRENSDVCLEPIDKHPVIAQLQEALSKLNTFLKSTSSSFVEYFISENSYSPELDNIDFWNDYIK